MEREEILNCYFNGTNYVPIEPWFDPHHPRIIKFNDTWLWNNMTYDEWRGLVEYRNLVTRRIEHARSIVIQSLNAFGLVGNAFILLTVDCIRRRSKLNTFFAVIGAIAALHFIFLLKLISRYCVPDEKMFESFLIFYSISVGLGSFCSMLGDLLTFGLTLDRFLAFGYPIVYNSQKRHRRVWAWATFVCVSILISSFRFHYLFDNYHYEDFKITTQRWYLGVCYFSDIVAPVIIALSILFFVLGIVVMIFRRRRQKNEQPLGQFVQSRNSMGLDDVHRKTRQHTSLFVVLVLAYFLNLIGYLVFNCVNFLKDQIEVNYSSSFEEIERYVSINVWLEASDFLCDVLETLTRSMLFYAYIAFNGNFFMNFIKAMSSLLEAILFRYCKRC